MAVTSRGRPSHLQIPSKWRDSETSPNRTSIIETPNLAMTPRKVPVVYYLSRNGQLEHPHFMEVPLSSPRGLFLRDVINRLNLLRGKGMASLYSWSSKRSYKTGFVWHDLSENDFIHPSHGHEYVLKGSELLDPPVNSLALESASSRSLRPPPEAEKSGDDFDSPLIVRRRNQSWSSIDLNEYKVYKTESVGESAGKAAADASTQTDDKRHRRRVVREERDDKVQGQSQQEVLQIHSQSTELSRGEISPPPSDSSPETLESLMKADGRLVICTNGASDEGLHRTAEVCPGGKMKASSVLMQLLSCGSISFRDCGSTAVRGEGFSLIGHYKARLPRGGAGNQVRTELNPPSHSDSDAKRGFYTLWYMGTPEAEYAAFEEKVKRTVYLDNISPQVTDIVVRTALSQFGTVKNVQFIPDYFKSRNIGQCALVEMENPKQADAIVSEIAQFPFMMAGMPRPVRACPAKVEMFDDRPAKPGRNISCRWLEPNDPDFEVAQKLKRLNKKHAAEASSLLKQQLQEEENLAKQQNEALKANHKKYEMIDSVIADGTARHLAKRYKMRIADDW